MRAATSTPTFPAMTGATASPPDWFAEVDGIVADPLRFKARLGIGERAYASLRLRNAAFQAWDVAGVAVTGATIAKSSAVATALFSTGGFWAWFGLGATPVTPIGWIVAAGLASGGVWYGVTRYLKSREQGRVTVIPNLISTPMDELALALFDLLAPIALRLARAKGDLGSAEHAAITGYFTRAWGYDAGFVSGALGFLETAPSGQPVKRLARLLAAFNRENPDCDEAAMADDIQTFLHTVAAADGPPSPRQKLILAQIDRAFASERGGRPRRFARRWKQRITAARARKRPPPPRPPIES